MQLPFLSKNKPQKSFFLSLLIKPYSVGSILFEEVDSKLFILSNHEVETSKDTSTLTPEELLSASDRAISFIEHSLPEGSTVDKTIFSVPYSWVDEGKIMKDYLALLKKVCEELGLTPVGYLVSIEAIIHFLQDQEGAPVSALFVEIAKRKIFVYLVRAGKIIEVQSAEIEKNVLATVELLLKQIDTVDVLPSKIVLFNYRDAEDVQQEFLSHIWPKDIPFLHLPQVIVLEKGAENEATINGVAQQMELEVLQDIKIRPETMEDEPVEKLKEAKSEEFGFTKADIADEDAVPVKKTKEVETASVLLGRDFVESKEESNLGVPDKDSVAEAEKAIFASDRISSDEQTENPIEEEIRIPKREKSNFEESNIANFRKDGEPEPEEEFKKPKKALMEEAEVEAAPIRQRRDVSTADESDEDVEEEADSDKKKIALPIALPSLSILKTIKLPVNLVKLPFSFISGVGGSAQKIKLVLVAVVLIVLVVGVSFLYYNFFLTAHVTVFADKRAIDKTTPVTFSTSPAGDNEIKLNLVDREVKGSDTKNSTGTKETGDQAKGEVTIYNKTENTKTFNNGAVVVGPNNLEYQLQGDINIASTSSFSTTLSSAKGKVTASKFGQEYNLASGTNFTLKGFSSSDFIAKNENAINGGSKKETTVVSKKDLDALLASVTDKLKSQAISDASAEASGSKQILSEPLTADVTDKSYDKKEGDASGTVGISATIKYSIGEYDKQDLQKIIASLATGVIPGTYALQENGSKVDITDVKVKDDSATATLKVNAIYSPKIATDSLINSIKGKSVTSAERQIKGITGVTDVVISFTKEIPLFPKILPVSPRNIIVEVKE